MGRIEYHAMPVPAFPEHTVYVDAGVVLFGVEYRHLDEELIASFYGPDARAKFGGVRPAGMAEVVVEDGLALHVFSAETGEEVLRFDCFDDAPHYHLLDHAAGLNTVVDHDVAAHGLLADWALAELARDLPAWLQDAGAGNLADQVDVVAAQTALKTVAQVAAYVVAAGRPVPVGQGPS